MQTTSPRLRTLPRIGCLLLAAVMLHGCNSLSYAQRENPNKLFQEHKASTANNASVLGIGEPMSTRQMKANATISMQGNYDVDQVMQKISSTYNLAVRWGNGVRRNKRLQLMVNQLTFDEARNYVEDVYDVQIIREGERRLLVLPSASEPRLASFNPGENVTLAAAIKGLAEQCGYNLVITENKQELNQIRVTTQLKDVTCFDAFEAMLNPHGLSILNTGDYYTVGGLPQRQWTLELYEPVRVEEQTVNLSTDFSAGSGSSAEGGTATGGQSTSGTNNVTIKYERNLWKDLEGDLNQMITNSCPRAPEQPEMMMDGSAPQNTAVILPPPTGSGAPDTHLMNPQLQPAVVNQAASNSSRSSSSRTEEEEETNRCGYVRINPAVGMVQMRAPRSVLDEANTLIQRVQDIASRRLLLEARVIAVTRSRGYSQDGRFRFGNVNAAEGTSNGGGYTGSVTSAIAEELLNFTTDFGDGTTVNSSGLGIRTKNLDAAVSLLERFGTTYTLMRPMMELMDRQRATLIDGLNERYYLVQSETTTGTATTTSGTVEERSQFVGLQFSASAQIGESGEPHTISLQIPITDIQRRINIPKADGTASTSTAPIVSTRLIDQKVRVRDGEIKVIGGLTKTVAVDDESGVPLLRDITALGKLVNTEKIRYENVEFVVLLQVRRLT